MSEERLPNKFDALVFNLALWALIGLVLWWLLAPAHSTELPIPKRGTAHYWYICARADCEKPKPKEEPSGYDSGLRYDEPTPKKSHKK